jgi:glycerate dehydrogenase
MARRPKPFVSTVACGIDKDDLTGAEWVRLQATTGRLARLARAPPRGEPLSSADCLLLDIDIEADAAFIEAALNLQYVGVFGTGFSTVDLKAARKQGVTVTNVPDYATQAVAEFTLAAALVELRHLHEAALVHPPPPSQLRGRELRGTRVGVVGLGRIGAAVARLASEGFGARVSYWSRTRRKGVERAGVSYMPLDKLLRESQVISLHLALNDGTANILNAGRVGDLPEGALLLNFASAGLVDQAALVRGVRAGRLRVVVDHADELRPATLRALRRLPGARIYPPIGYETEEARRARADIFLDNIERFLDGRPRNIVTPPA